MSETVALQPIAFKRKIPRTMRSKLAQIEIGRARQTPLDATELQARAKVGKYIEQQGSADISRSELAHTYSMMEATKRKIDIKIQKAEDEKDEESYLKWFDMLTHCLEVMARTAVALSHTSNSRNANDEPVNNTPTMPARTVINNNTQVNIVPPKTPEPPNGNPA